MQDLVAFAERIAALLTSRKQTIVIAESSTAEPTGDKSGGTYTDMASNAASSAASAASAAAVNVKDNVFSMFGGGAKKEKKEEEDTSAPGEKSGSSKAQKEAEGEDGAVSFLSTTHSTP